MALAAVFGARDGTAQTPPPSPALPVSPSENASSGSGGSSALQNNTLLGDLFGLRSALSSYGITITLQETSEVLGNPLGGIRQGADYHGLTQAALQLDTEQAFGWHGGLFNISALQIHGRDLTEDDLSTFQTASGIEANRATRLWELWYQQKFLKNDRLDIKVGQQSLDQEFIVSTNGALFVNASFGWPLVPSFDLPGGGPAYPLASPGIRFRYRPSDTLALLLGVYNGSPSATDQGNAQLANESGVQFPITRGPLVFAELQYGDPAGGAVDEPGAGAPLGHTYKLGAWYNGERLNDVRFDSAGLPLHGPNSTGLPRRHAGNYSVYAVADQMVWRSSHTPNESVSVFARAMGTPQADRNVIDSAVDGGVVGGGAGPAQRPARRQRGARLRLRPRKRAGGGVGQRRRLEPREATGQL